MGGAEPAQPVIPQARANAIRMLLLCRFANRLREIRIAAGKPSYRALRKFDPNLPKSTISDALRGTSAPRYTFVRDYLRACRRYAQANGRPVDSLLFDEAALFEMWSELQFDLDDLQRHAQEAIAEPVTGDAIGRRAGDWCRLARDAATSSAEVDLPLLMQVRDGLQRSRPA